MNKEKDFERSLRLPFDEIDPDANGIITDAGSVLEAVYSGQLPISDVELDCAVLDNGARVLSERAVHRAFGSKRGGSHWKRMKEVEGGDNLPSFLSAKNYSPFISQELMQSLKDPVIYSATSGGMVAHGIRAELLPEICGVFLAARRAGVLHRTQEHLAIQAEVLMEAFAKVGIIALVDEATGYQHDRSHDALRLLLSKYIAQGLQKWLKTFPDTFFAELDRLYNNDTRHGKRPQYYGLFINKYVYLPIENGYVKKELDKLNVTDEGKRKARFHQWLSDDGRNMLVHQIGRVQGLMEICTDITHFRKSAEKQRSVSIAPYLFDEMNRIVE
ncbi:P63C domain-containing protein [Cobetia amphilecti]|uniref:P63C domain-containing protein n=1 Tax=Cobetia amphilecti TaxID=1055104 RepID=UPI00254B0EC5|nr:P63C domain-containing protein [Cobetia amphilecti]